MSDEYGAKLLLGPAQLTGDGVSDSAAHPPHVGERPPVHGLAVAIAQQPERRRGRGVGAARGVVAGPQLARRTTRPQTVSPRTSGMPSLHCYLRPAPSTPRA